jgi:predicted transcriptional regulator
MNLLQAIRRDLKDANTARLRAISKRTGVPMNTVWRIVSGTSPNPRYNSVYRLSKYRRDWKTH